MVTIESLRPVALNFGYKISERQAKRLVKENNTKLPRPGHEKLVEIGPEATRYWLARTVHNGKQVWYIYEASKAWQKPNLK